MACLTGNTYYHTFKINFRTTPANKLTRIAFPQHPHSWDSQYTWGLRHAFITHPGLKISAKYKEQRDATVLPTALLEWTRYYKLSQSDREDGNKWSHMRLEGDDRLRCQTNRHSLSARMGISDHEMVDTSKKDRLSRLKWRLHGKALSRGFKHASSPRALCWLNLDVIFRFWNAFSVIWCHRLWFVRVSIFPWESFYEDKIVWSYKRNWSKLKYLYILL